MALTQTGIQAKEAGTLAGIHGLGMTAQEIADMIKASSAAALPLIVAQNPGTILRQNPDGSMTVYSQPTGTQANLPVSFVDANFGAGGQWGAGGWSNIQTPIGSANFGLGGGTLSMGTVLVVALIVAFALRK
jgi:hypothetical protein